MTSRLKSLLAVALVSFTASAAFADHVAPPATTAQRRAATTTDEYRSELIRQQNAIEAARAPKPVVAAPQASAKRRYPTTTDEARGLY